MVLHVLRTLNRCSATAPHSLRTSMHHAQLADSQLLLSPCFWHTKAACRLSTDAATTQSCTVSVIAAVLTAIRA
jgi:hypothetical protein